MFPPFISRSDALPPLVPSFIGVLCGSCVSRGIKTCAVATAAGSTVETARMISGCTRGGMLGAVYCPKTAPGGSLRVVTRVPTVELPPGIPLTVQAKPDAIGPPTIAVKFWPSPGNRATELGDRSMVIGLATLTCALPEAELLAAEVAVTITSAGLGVNAGAV